MYSTPSKYIEKRLPKAIDSYANTHVEVILQDIDWSTDVIKFIVNNASSVSVVKIHRIIKSLKDGASERI